MTGAGLVDDAVQRVKDVWAGVREHASPSIRRFTAANGDAKITKIVVCRMPVTPAIEKLASIISAGRWDANKKKLQYDKMWHLFMIMTLDNGKIFKIEKNHLPEISRKNEHWQRLCGSTNTEVDHLP